MTKDQRLPGETGPERVARILAASRTAEAPAYEEFPLPPLPHPSGLMHGVPYFSEDQLRRYGRVCAIAHAPPGRITADDVKWAYGTKGLPISDADAEAAAQTMNRNEEGVSK